MQSLAILALLICLSFAFVKIPLKKFYKEPLAASNSTSPLMTELLSSSDLQNNLNWVYSAKIYVGSPPKLFTVVIGTGAPFLWIPSKRCQNVCHEASNYFDPYSSSTYKNLGQSNRITYDFSNFVEGDLSQETFYIGDDYALTIKNQVFTLVHKDSGMDFLNADGVLGLTYGSISGYPTFLENLRSQGQISQKIFSVYLHDNDFAGSNYDGSAIIFGGYDLASYAQSTEIKYIDVYQDDGLWNLQVSNVRVNNVPIPTRTYYALFDVGSTFNFIPKVVYDAIYNQLSAAGSCLLNNGFIECNCYDYPLGSYPSISFVFGGKYTFSLEPEHYFYRYRKMCTLLFYTGLDYWLFGTPFLRKYYTIFDAEFLQIGFAIAKNWKTTKFIDILGPESDLIDEGKMENIKNEAQAEEKAMENRSQSSTNALYWVLSGVLLGFLSGFLYHSYKIKKENPQEIYYQKIQA
ncbi:unnamed protein product [Blepharisma stoltei]|uniref:Peptidase A1 domain-containing protein n=1 Tax=Blepharisma stoltei TaxID=1481888 RepID=A0AAU9JJK8_9CILI|nr:unnamed protein product [Blepharisma stoltei]